MLFEDLIESQKKNIPVGVTSICSANKYVLEAAMRFAKKNNKDVLIEATSNQVDQFGGYTGMIPKHFRDYVYDLADGIGFDKRKIILGGDHLGPNVWKNESSNTAMKKAEEQIEAYIRAGFRKIHLDTSFVLKNDRTINGNALPPRIITERAARLCRVAEITYSNLKYESEKPVYIIGTEVPIPGGATENEDRIEVTKVEDFEETVTISRNAFFDIGLEEAWERVIGVVVQPGVEFSDSKVFPYMRENATKLKKKIENYNRLLLEAHSTDYQNKIALKQMVEDHFAILKVGPWLTYALREALFSLAAIEDELLINKKNSKYSDFRSVIRRAMDKHPANWAKHYHGSDLDIQISKSFSYSDRIRYYWNNSEIKDSLNQLITNLEKIEIPITLVGQYLPKQYNEIRENRLLNNPGEIIINKISEVLSIYDYATGGDIEN